MNQEWSKETMAKNLKYYMEKTGKTQKELATVAGVSEPTFSYWINGIKYPRIDKIQKLADYFGILKSDLIEEKVTPEMQKNSDTMVDITVRIASDIDFRNVVKRNMYDKDFFSLSVMLCDLSDEQIISVKQMLGTFFK
nr:MAG TPA: Repressor protein CI [Caudoviricetes sp.]